MRPQWLLLLAALALVGASTDVQRPVPTRLAKPAVRPVTRPSPMCPPGNPPTSVMPKWFKKALPGQLTAWAYDGISPFAKYGARQDKNNLAIPLFGRGSANPLQQDPFGAGMRISSRYAYLGGRLCAWVVLPEPASGTIFGMYLIDTHPKGSDRSGTRWREADLEWLGLRPDEVQTSVFEQGREQPNAMWHNTAQLLGASQREPIRYCIDWDLRKKDAASKYVKFTARSTKHPQWVTLREWRPSSAEVADFWNEPLRAIFTFWSNNHIVGWSGAYNVPDGKVLWGVLKDIQFKPRGPAFCPKLDNDLEPMT